MEEFKLNFFDLHWEDILISHILPRLSVKDLMQLRAVSSAGSRLVQTYFECNNVLDLSDTIYSIFTETTFQLVTRGSSHLRRLNLCGGSLRWLRNDVLYPVLAANCDLTHLDLSNCYGLTEEILVALSTCDCISRLRVLKLSGCGWADGESLRVLLSASQQLEEVDLTGCWGCGGPRVASVLVAHNPGLRRLALANVYGLRDESVEVVARNASDLRHLDVRECYRLTNGCMLMLAEYAVTLESLLVKGCRDITEDGLERLRNRGVQIDVQPPRKLEFKTIPGKHLNLQI